MKSLKQLLILALLFLPHVFLYAEENVSQDSVENAAEVPAVENKNKSVFHKLNLRPYFFTNFPKEYKENFNDEFVLETSRSSSKGIFVNSLTVAFYNTFFYDYGRILAALQLTEDSTSFTAEDIFWFFKLYDDDEKEKLVFRLGVDLYFNYEYLNEISSKYIIFYGLAGELFSGPYLTLSSKIFAGNRFSNVFLQGKDSCFLHNWDIQMEFTIEGKTKINLCPYLTIASFEDFRYPLFFSPIFTLGLEYISLDKFSLGISGSLRYIDAFTLSSYMDSWTVRVYAGYAIK